MITGFCAHRVAAEHQPDSAVWQ